MLHNIKLQLPLIIVVSLQRAPSERTFSRQRKKATGNITLPRIALILAISPLLLIVPFDNLSSSYRLVLLYCVLELLVGMASSKKQAKSMPRYIVDQTIFFLRPKNQEAIAVLNATENDLYRVDVAAPNELTNQQLGEIFDEDSTSSEASSEDSREQLLGKMSEVAPQAHNPSSSVSTETSGIKIQRHPFAFRFGFDSVENPSREGFAFGGRPECNVQVVVGCVRSNGQ